VLRRVIELDQHAALALGASGGAPLSVVVAEPIFDDFGDVFAALIAHRSLRSREPTLEEFLATRRRGAGGFCRRAIDFGCGNFRELGAAVARARFLPAAQQ
jgi:hypothetical protein